MPSPTIRMTFFARLVLLLLRQDALQLPLRLLEVGIVPLHQPGVLGLRRPRRQGDERRGRR